MFLLETTNTEFGYIRWWHWHYKPELSSFLTWFDNPVSLAPPPLTAPCCQWYTYNVATVLIHMESGKFVYCYNWWHWSQNSISLIISQLGPLNETMKFLDQTPLPSLRTGIKYLLYYISMDADAEYCKPFSLIGFMCMLCVALSQLDYGYFRTSFQVISNGLNSPEWRTRKSLGCINRWIKAMATESDT